MQKIKEYRLFWCETCADKIEMDSDALKQHMLEVHKIDISNHKAQRTMISHVDARTWYSYQWRWTFADIIAEPAGKEITIYEESQYNRSKDDPMRYC